MLRLNNLRLENGSDNGQVRLLCDMEQGGNVTTFWLSFDAKLRDFITADRYDAFLTMALLYAMKLGEDIAVEGAVSERLYYGCVNALIPQIAVFLPGMKPVSISVDACWRGEGAEKPAGVGVLFSGGVDSMHVVMTHLEPDIPAGFRPTHLLFTNVGTQGNSFYGDIGRARELFHKRQRHLGAFATEAGLEFIAVDSNWYEHFSWQPAQQVVTLNIAVGQALQGLFGKIFYPDQYGFRESIQWAPGNLVIRQPQTVPWMSTETLDCLTAGGQDPRLDKLEYLAKSPLARKHLDVCVPAYDAEKINCTVNCVKCTRIMVMLDVLGLVDRFGEVFDLDQYYKLRNRCIAELLYSKGTSPITDQTIERARAGGFKWPLRPRLYNAGKSIERFFRRPVRRLTARLRGLGRHRRGR